MAVSFEKHRAQIVAAWKDVLDDKSSTNWSLFGYEGQTNELKVVGSGEGGLEELMDDLNSGKIMYAFVRLEDPRSGLNKFLLVNWQGEGAPVVRKGTCANHIHDVAKLLSGAQLTINARNEDDMETERLLKQLSTANSAYSFKSPRAVQEEQKLPVGTNYSRVIPTKELNASAMQDFWKKEEAEEKQRIAAEKEAQRLRIAKTEQEQRIREEQEHRKREERIVGAGKLQPVHMPIKTSPQPLSPEKITRNAFGSMTEAERMRLARQQEARELIGSRFGAAKAMFTKNTSEGQLQTKLNTAPPAKPARTSIAQRINAFNQPQQQQQQQQIEQPARPGKIELPKTEAPIVEEQKSQPVAAIVDNQNNKHSNGEAHMELPVMAEITANAYSDEVNNQDDYPPELETEQYSTIKRSPHSKSNSLQSPDGNSSSNATDTAVFQGTDDDDDDDDDNERDNDEAEEEQEQEIRTKVSVTVQQSQSAQNGMNNSNSSSSKLLAIERDVINDDYFICQDGIGSDLGLRARALYDYQAADESEITFDPGDVITHIDQIDEGWWQGLGPDGTYGLFPANYVEIIN